MRELGQTISYILAPAVQAITLVMKSNTYAQKHITLGVQFRDAIIIIINIILIVMVDVILIYNTYKPGSIPSNSNHLDINARRRQLAFCK